MKMSHNILDDVHNRIMTEHWANAVGIEPFKLFQEPNCDNILSYALKHDVWFEPDRDEDGVIIDNDRLEHFRLAYLHDVLSNIADIATNLDDDCQDDLNVLQLLTMNDPDENGTQGWYRYHNPDSLVYRTRRDMRTR